MHEDEHGLNPPQEGITLKELVVVVQQDGGVGHWGIPKGRDSRHPGEAEWTNTCIHVNTHIYTDKHTFKIQIYIHTCIHTCIHRDTQRRKREGGGEEEYQHED